jgi:hypothetical protein
MGVNYRTDGTVYCTEVYRDTGEEVPNGRTLLIPAGPKAGQDAALLAFVLASPAVDPTPQTPG